MRQNKSLKDLTYNNINSTFLENSHINDNFMESYSAKDINFSVESFDFHLDYDIIITKVILVNNEVSYTKVGNRYYLSQ